MKRIAVLVPVTLLMIVLLAGCGTKEREELKAQVITLQQQIELDKTTLAERESELNNLKTDLQNTQVERDNAMEKLASANEQLTVAKKELAKLKAVKPKATKTALKTTTKPTTVKK